MGELLGIHPIRNGDIEWIYDQVSNIRAYNFSNVLTPEHHPITFMHGHHRNSDEMRKAMCADMKEHVNKHCPEWEKRFGAFNGETRENGNVEWEKWEPDMVPRSGSAWKCKKKSQG